MPAQMKKCCRCKEEKSISDFSKRSANKDGLSYHCKSCAKKANDLNREHLRELDRASYYRNQKDRIAKSSKYEYLKRENALPEKFHREPKEVSSPRTWEDTLARLRGIKVKNKERYKEEYKKWSSTERGKLLNALKSQRYRARKSNTINTLTETDVAMVLIFQGRECAKCGKSFDQVKYEIDHVVPVSLGGDTVLENIQLLCRSCNASKRAKIIRYIPEITETIKRSLGDLLCLH